MACGENLKPRKDKAPSRCKQVGTVLTWGAWLTDELISDHEGYYSHTDHQCDHQIDPTIKLHLYTQISTQAYIQKDQSNANQCVPASKSMLPF